MVLGLSDYEFWRLTPRQFKALADRYNETQDAINWRFANLYAVIINTTPGIDRTVNAEEFMPTRSIKPKTQTVKEQMNSAKAITRILGGEVNNG